MGVTTDRPLPLRRLAIRRRAMANMLLVLRAEARRSGGRFEVDGMPDAVLFRFRDVVTLVCRDGTFAIERRDFTLIVVCPALWPFDRDDALIPLVLVPMDFRHPNSDSHQFCLDARGIAPERLAELLYDNIRLKSHRLDHCVDTAAAAFVRAHLPDRPADSRSLYPEVRSA